MPLSLKNMLLNEITFQILFGRKKAWYISPIVRLWAAENERPFSPKNLKSQQKKPRSLIYVIYVKFIYSEKATKILRNLPLTFDCMYCSQKLVEDFAQFLCPSQNI